MGDSSLQQSQRLATQGREQTRPALLLGRYRIMAQDATGGFGTVLTCWDTRLQRRVAIKRIPLVPQGGAAAGTSTIDEALSEARTSSMLAHPNIVTMFDFEVDRSFAYLVMEYVDGLTLQEFLSRVEGGTLTGDECAYLVQEVAKALSFAHENGVLHLDIKPSNIMIEHSGAIKLCDFGMAMLASAAGYGGARGGTVGYMPPEQIEGGMVDERTDIFSLAVVVWQALTGEDPFAAKTAQESLRKIERGPKVPLGKLDPAFAGMAEEAVMQALDPRITQRIPSVEAFANEVTFGLGDPDIGAQSIRELMNQDEKDEARRSEEFKPEELPLLYRYPWLAGVCERGLAAVLTAVTVFQAAPALATDPTVVAGGTLACAAAAAAWPPLGAALAMLALAAALLGGAGAGSAATVLLPLACTVGFLSWWIPVGTDERLSTAAVLLPCATGQAGCASALAGFCLPPARAAATAGVALAWRSLFLAAVQARFDAAATAAALLARLALPSFWILLLGSCVAAGVCARLYRWRGTVASGVAGQVLCAAILIAAQVIALRVENGGIWMPPTWEYAVSAIILCLLVCIATNLRGPLAADGEVEDIDELV